MGIIVVVVIIVLFAERTATVAEVGGKKSGGQCIGNEPIELVSGLRVDGSRDPCCTRSIRI